MASGADTTSITARFLLPSMYERGRANALSCPLWQDGALVAPTQAGSTVTIYDASNTVQVSAAAVTVTGSVATYSYAPASTLTLGDGWREEWSLIVAGVTHVFRQDASLVRHVLHCPITDADLFRRVSSLDPSGGDPISTLTDFQDYLDEAHVIIQNRLIGKGLRPFLVLNPSALRETYITLTLSLIFADFATKLNETYEMRAREWKQDYLDAWQDIRFVYDQNHDGEPDNAGRRSANPTIWLSGRY